MVFPQNIANRLAKKKRNKANTKATITWMVTVLVLLVNRLFFVPLFYEVMPKWLIILITNLIILLVAQFPIRKLCFREDERMEEFLSRGSESFVKYFGIRNIDTRESINVNGYDVPVFETLVNTHAVYLKLQLGKANLHTAKETQKMFKDVFKILGENGFGWADFTYRSVFSESKEGRDMLEEIDSVEDLRFRKFVADIYKHAIDLADLNSNSPEYVLEIRTQTYPQRIQMEYVLKTVLERIYTGNTSIRKVEFMGGPEVLELGKRFYKLNAIDISRSIVFEYIQDEELEVGPVGLYRVGKKGRIMTYPDRLAFRMDATKL